MKRMKNKLIFIIIFSILLLNGCWDMREINELGLVTAVGIDKGTGNNYSITVEIANPTSENSNENSSSAQNTVWIGTEEGASLFDAARKLVEISSRRIMWAHNNVVIIGESLAKEGIIPVIDYFTHNPELRMKSSVVVSKGDAKDYITAKAGMESPSGVSFILLEGYRAISAESIESHLLEVSSELKSEYGNPLITEISMKKALLQSQSGKGGNQEYSKTIDLEGIAVFKKDKMIGSLSPGDSRGVAWILNQTESTVVTVTDPEYGNKNVSVETKAVKAKIKTEIIKGMPQISINITGKGNIVEEDGSTNKNLNEVKENVTKIINKKIEQEIMNSLNIIQKEYMVDCLGFANIVHVQNSREWQKGLNKNWEKIFPQIPVNVSVDIKIKTSTLNQESNRIF